MRNDIKWESSIEFSKEKIERYLRQLEGQWKIKFPEQYVEIVLKNDRALPYIKNEKDEWISGTVLLPKFGKMMIEMMSLIEIDFDGKSTTSIELSYDALSEALPDQIFPFAQDGSGDKLLFDYRNSYDNPRIVFIDHDDLITEEWLSEEELEEKSLEEWQDEKIYLVCNSFNEFINSIEMVD